MTKRELRALQWFSANGPTTDVQPMVSDTVRTRLISMGLVERRASHDKVGSYNAIEYAITTAGLEALK